MSENNWKYMKTKSISINNRYENSELFLNIISLFSTYDSVSDSKVVIDAVINYYFPDWFIDRSLFMAVMNERTDSRISMLIGRYISTFGNCPDSIRAKSVALIWELVDYHKYCDSESEDREKYFKLIGNHLNFIRGEAEKDINEKPEKYNLAKLKYICRNMSYLQKEWETSHSIFILADVYNCFASHWEYFSNSIIVRSVIEMGLKVYNLKCNDDLFLKIYEIIRRLSEENYKLEAIRKAQTADKNVSTADNQA